MASLDRPLPDEPLMTAKVAAGKLGMSVKSMMKHVREGRLRFINIGTVDRKAYRFTTYNLTTFIEKQKTTETPECQSTKALKAHFTGTISKSTVVAFSVYQSQKQKRRGRRRARFEG